MRQPLSSIEPGEHASFTPAETRHAMNAAGAPRSANGERPTETVELTTDLVEKARSGDGNALNRLAERCLPSLRSWTRGRLPYGARDAHDTEDLVQEAFCRTLGRLAWFEPRGRGALLAYLRQAVENRIRDDIRRRRRRPAARTLHDDHCDQQSSPLDHLIGVETLERYRRALQSLRPDDRQAVVARVERKWDYARIASELGKPSADAARMAVGRALVRLSEAMAHTR
jgi:RNA polymerase sigma-70 factor (ECF subfamily)